MSRIRFVGKRNTAVVQGALDRLSQNQKVALAQTFVLFSGVSPADCTTIISSGHEKRLCRHQTLFCAGDSVEQVFLVLSGSVKITQVGSNGSEVILRISGIGNLVGVFGLGPQCTHGSAAQAVQPCIALVWESAIFTQLLDHFAMFRRNTFRALEDHLQEIEQRFRELSTEDVASRLSSELIRLSNRFGDGVNGNGVIRLSHADLAQLTGTTLSTVSRLLSRWQKLGIVSMWREAVKIRDAVALAQVSESE